MKLKLTLALVALAGLASALALAGPTQAGDGKHAATTTTTTGTTSTGTSTGKKDDGDHGGHHGNASCQKVELRGTNGSGSVTLLVAKANNAGASLVGKQVTLNVTASSTVGATACVDAAGVLTLRSLVVRPPAAAPTTTTTTTTTTTNSNTKSAVAALAPPQLAPLIEPARTARGAPTEGVPRVFDRRAL